VTIRIAQGHQLRWPIDAADAITGIGLVILVAGIGRQFSAGWAMILGGAVLMVLGLAGAIQKSK
jgi:hypothetical protein